MRRLEKKKELGGIKGDRRWRREKGKGAWKERNHETAFLSTSTVISFYKKINLVIELRGEERERVIKIIFTRLVEKAGDRRRSLQPLLFL